MSCRSFQLRTRLYDAQFRPFASVGRADLFSECVPTVQSVPLSESPVQDDTLVSNRYSLSNGSAVSFLRHHEFRRANGL